MNKKRYLAVISIFFIFMLVTLITAPLIGSTRINLEKALSRTLIFADNMDANILFIVRFPRILLAAVTGAALAVSGVAFQAILRNDLAAPITLGVSGGAALGAVIAIRLGLGFTFLGFSTIPIFSFLGAVSAILLVFSFVRLRRRELPTTYLLLAGVTVNLFFASLVMLIQYLSNITQSFQIVRWLMGGLDITDYKTVISISPLVITGIGILIYMARDLNLISTGVDPAMSRGVDVIRVQYTGLIAGALATGAVVAVAGPIGFVGLVVPHVVRLLIGPDHRLVLPASVFFGAGFLIICDTLARTIIAPTELPVGIITALIGGPFFFWLLKRQQ